MNTTRSVAAAPLGLLALTLMSGAQPVERPDSSPRPNAVVVTPRPESPPEPWRRLQAEIWTDEDVYRIGDSIEVLFEVNRDAHVYIFNTDAAGRTTQIFPNYFDQDNFIRGGHTCSIPRRGYDLVVTGPPGRERLEIYAVTDPGRLRGLFEAYSAEQPFAPLSAEGRAALNAIQAAPATPSTQRVEIVPVPEPQDWDRESVWFDVVGARYPPPQINGTLVIRCTPSHVAVFIDGVFAGYAPGTIANLTPGEHDIELSRPGWVTHRGEIHIEPARPTYLNIALRREGYRRWRW